MKYDWNFMIAISRNIFFLIVKLNGIWNGSDFDKAFSSSNLFINSVLKANEVELKSKIFVEIKTVV